MPMELRKRKEAPAPPPAPARKKTTKTAKTANTATKVKEAVKEKVAAVVASTNGSSDSAKPAVGDTINLDSFGGEIETNEGTKTTLKALVDESKAGVAIFTYPKASTPGCKPTHPPSPEYGIPPLPTLPKHPYSHTHSPVKPQ
ncbi:uncharacterized protein B0H64DRAFT_390219 [Chaetomium fimeti]|uniref:Thioredoxin domain-containing protein n=1 Tax=Chaetomium fimeti TaxID=1854472 RepID=A0AAE0LU04_9PEZI|nr:hypothetical protein B0H64DRAFT_390219 [Chaetomium fimeti]